MFLFFLYRCFYLCVQSLPLSLSLSLSLPPPPLSLCLLENIGSDAPAASFMWLVLTSKWCFIQLFVLSLKTRSWFSELWRHRCAPNTRLITGHQRETSLHLRLLNDNSNNKSHTLPVSARGMSVLCYRSNSIRWYCRWTLEVSVEHQLLLWKAWNNKLNWDHFHEAGLKMDGGRRFSIFIYSQWSSLSF